VSKKFKWARRALVTLVGAASLVSVSAGPSWAIIGGRQAFYTDAPYIVAVLDNGNIFCGASQLNATTLISAAHCFENHQVENLSIRIGSLDWDTGGTVVPIRDVIINPGFNSNTYDNDIAIMHTTRPMPGIRPIALPAVGSDPLPASDVRVSGWGRTAEDGPAVRRLRTALLPVQSRDVCTTDYANFQRITSNMFCAGTEAVDACQGDSGGPAVATNLEGDRVLEGVVSFGEGCARTERPGVFTRVSTYLDWIQNNE
jgi:trypsin